MAPTSKRRLRVTNVKTARLNIGFSLLYTFAEQNFHKISLRAAGYVYVLFECESSVKTLLQSCSMQSERDFNVPTTGEYYYKISSRRMRSKEVRCVLRWGSKCHAEQTDPLLPSQTRESSYIARTRTHTRTHTHTLVALHGVCVVQSCNTTLGRGTPKAPHTH